MFGVAVVASIARCRGLSRRLLTAPTPRQPSLCRVDLVPGRTATLSGFDLFYGAVAHNNPPAAA